MGTVSATAGLARSEIQIRRPKFAEVWSAYPVGMSAKDTYRLAGGSVYEHYVEDPIAYANACGVRLSRAFNYGGMEIPKGPGEYKLRGGDEKAYIMRASDMLKFVRRQFGTPDVSINTSGQDAHTQLSGMKGIVIFEVSGWRNATGHVTLWNGMDCGDSCYFTHATSAERTTAVHYWELK